MGELMQPHYWLAEVNQYGYGELVDGPHESREGVEQALYLFRRLGLERDRKFACAHVTLTPVEPLSHGANEEAISTLNDIGLKPAPSPPSTRRGEVSKLRYGQWTISPTDPLPPIPTWRRFAWSFVHDDYDGAEDAHDHRCGYAESPEACLAEIAAWEEEHDHD